MFVSCPRNCGFMDGDCFVVDVFGVLNKQLLKCSTPKSLEGFHNSQLDFKNGWFENTTTTDLSELHKNHLFRQRGLSTWVNGWSSSCFTLSEQWNKPWLFMRSKGLYYKLNIEIIRSHYKDPYWNHQDFMESAGFLWPWLKLPSSWTNQPR